MKKLLLSLSVIGIMATLCGCNNNVNPEELAIIGPEFIGVSNTFTYKVETNPVAAIKDVVWSVDKEDIATIDQTGKLTPKTEGELKITIKFKNNENIKSTLNIKVYDGLDNDEDFLTKYNTIYANLCKQENRDAKVAIGDFIIHDSGKVTEFYDIKFIKPGTAGTKVPNFYCKFKKYSREYDTYVPIKEPSKVKEDFDSVAALKEKGKEAELFCKLDSDISSYFIHLNTGSVQTFEYKSFDKDGYLIRHKLTLTDSENSFQTIENFHISF